MRGIFRLILQKSRFDSVNLHTASVRLRKRMGKQTMRCMACSLQQEDGEILEIKNRRFLGKRKKHGAVWRNEQHAF